ncbi:toll/interleukin-1 receptor domain-containing protein [Streptomyces guryensis]|uniref:Toll/interleukin-1 receptor domain-containing protein n=1 Tax=Streptomyces guryensis TaxID=2886947 RepID=A0A9Q3VNN4_9ACTN|nr:toll/interleukin-1 receptor domain-containing protein [Streptomyces guryensis]MCD9875641.1 toll/interleukin-1 receptor domain-containing protein [Streptomyces guryensis]
MDTDDPNPRARADGGRNWPMNVVQALLASPKLADGLTRALLFELVGAELAQPLEAADQPSLMREFLELVRYCEEQQGGLMALAHAVERIEGPGWTSHVVGELVRQRLARAPAAQVNGVEGAAQRRIDDRRDFFVSYTAADRGWAAWISWQLEKAGYSVLVQDWDFVAGSNWLFGMDGGVTQCERTIAVLSPAYLGSVYGRLEWQAVQNGDPDGLLRSLVPVMVVRCAPRGLLGSVVHIDLSSPDLGDEAAQELLLAGVGGARTGRSKPAVAPPFPRSEGPR